ncbi:uncharacterized protein LOC142231804 [Haematobia irritans]|uniref:uncharacterized protein LOC142231804 n=1 Tax=Haematobia irritans TaxID=7368 RepID=UPI003F50B98B
MELSEGYNKDTICRICLQPEPDLYPIFDPVKSQSTDTNFITPVTVAEILTECSKYKVTRDDKLPTNICLACLELARSAHSFKLQTEKSYRRLKALYDITWVSEEKDEGEGRLVNRYTQTEKSTIFQCESCTKKFFIESELRLHRTTCQILAKKCRVCGEIFNHLGQLKVHLSTEHPSEGIRCEYKCELCQREFARKDHMKRHVRKVHKIDDKLIVSKVSLDEPEIQIQNPTSLPTDLNNYSSHWPDYNEEEEEPDTTRNMEQNATVATNPFSSEDDDADFSNMDAEDVKNFAETLAQPEISIKVEKLDYMDSGLQNTKPQELTGGENSDQIIQTLKPEKTEGYEGKLEPVGFVDFDNQTYNDRVGDGGNTDGQTSESDDNYSDKYDDDDDNDEDDDDVEDKNVSKGEDHEDFKPLMENAKKEEQPTTLKESPTCSSNTKTRKPRRRYGTSNEEENRCKECDRTFSRYNHLLRHMLTHSDEKPHICKICSKGFSRSDHLQKHIQSIHAEKNYKCDQCDAAYGRKDHLQRHIETRHNKNPSVPKPQYACDMCEKKFTTKTYLARHRLLHTHRLYACKHCTATFTEKEQMKEHQKKEHSQPRNFLCSICGDSFQRNEYLKIHMRRHTGEKPYKCRFCEKGFPRSTDLKMHERYHIGLKPNLCNLCGKGFHRPYNLTIHMRTHTGEKPYKCPQCPQAFAQSNDLKAHIRRHTGERFRCDKCSAAFLQRYGLNAHLRSVHGIIVTSFTGRLRKADQAGGDHEEIPSTSDDAMMDKEACSEGSESLAPIHPQADNSTTPPLYLGQQFLNPLTASSTIQTPSIDVALLPPPLHPPPPTHL